MATFHTEQGGRPVLKNAGPVLMSPGGTLNFNVPQTPSFPADSAGTQREGFSVGASPTPPPGQPQAKTGGEPRSRAPVLRELFGGAISLQLPETYEDVSLLREVPDHQEVFVDRDSDASLIVELLEHDGAVSDDHAPAHYFRDLAACNDAEGSSVLDYAGVVAHAAFVPLLKVDPKRCVKCAAVGRQRITKFRSAPPSASAGAAGAVAAAAAEGDDVAIVMCVVRLLDVLTDILITLNVPVSSDSWEAFPGGPTAAKPPAPSVAASGTAASTSASTTGTTGGGGGSSRPESARAKADAARADVRAEAMTVVALLYKEPTVAMLLKATTLDGAPTAEGAPAGVAGEHAAPVAPTASGSDQQVLAVGRSLKTFHGLFARPAAAGHDDEAVTDAAQLPLYPHAVIKTALETFTVVNWQLFA